MFSISRSAPCVRVAHATSMRPKSAPRAVVARAETKNVKESLASADEAWKAKETAETENVMTIGDKIDPADGSVAEAAPLGNDNSLLDSAMVAFKNQRAVEIINGRAAMIGWMVALGAEINNNVSISHQVFNERTFTLADGVVRTSTYPGSGFFLIIPTVLIALAASLAPALKKSSPNGLNEKPEAFGPFNPDAEMINGRASMVGLVALPLAEKFINGSALF